MIPTSPEVGSPVDIAESTSRPNFICGVVEGFYGRPWSTDQRKRLFSRLNKMEMDTYIYAPKDDCKHRMFWREMYSVEEAEHLTGLIEAAASNNVSLVYAISPGIDLTYSSAKDLTLLKKKLEQVASFGCTSFAILFDDIEIDMCEADKGVFQSFADAQVSVTNEVYQHLGEPARFFFCPTEYCATRAIPDVATSGYLNTIGSRLLPGIDIMWTGPKVISKKITIKSIQEITEVLKRPPLIWDNLHANDYDPKRLFLGPYDGRSPELIPYLRGVLANPNTEFEANFIALHTLAQWSKSNCDGVKRDCILSSTINEDIRLETDGELCLDEDTPLNEASGYVPRMALTRAITDWVEELYMPYEAVKVKMIDMAPPAAVTAAVVISTSAVTSASQQPQCLVTPNLNTLAAINNSYLQPTSILQANSLIDPFSSESEADSSSEGTPEEPMDCFVNPASMADHDSELMMDEPVLPVIEEAIREVTAKDLALLIDMFYLPFEYGFQGSTMLCQLHWLKMNAHAMLEAKCAGVTAEQLALSEEWGTRCLSLINSVRDICGLMAKLQSIPNQALHKDLYPYLWDLSTTLALVESYVKWLGANKWYRDYFMSGDDEPWGFHGGLQAEFKRLLPFESAPDLLAFNNVPVKANTPLLLIRPYRPEDKTAVYEICRKTCDDGADGTDIFPELPDLIGDKLIGNFLCDATEYCFVVEDAAGICGYALASLDAKDFLNRLSDCWVPAMCEKYQKPCSTEGLNPSEEIIASLHAHQPPSVDTTVYPSCVRLDFLPDRILSVDPNIPRRALASAVGALKVNGSHGLFVEVNVGDASTSEMYSKLGFGQIGQGEEGSTILARGI